MELILPSILPQMNANVVFLMVVASCVNRHLLLVVDNILVLLLNEERPGIMAAKIQKHMHHITIKTNTIFCTSM